MDNYQELLILKACLQNTLFSSLLHGVFSKNKIDNPYISDILDAVISYHAEYKKLPSEDLIYNLLKDKTSINDYKDIINKSKSLDIKVKDGDEKDIDYIIDVTESYLKKQSLKNAIVNSVDVIGDDDKQVKEEDYLKVKDWVEDALICSMRKDIGLDYFNDMKERLERVFNADKFRIPTYYSSFDEYLNGGIGQYSLSLIVGKIHGFKSCLMSNIASRQVIRGKNVAIFSLEMSQDAYAQRHDAIFSKIDINRMYTSSSNRKTLIKRLVELKKDKDRGYLVIKQFPTGEASTNDFMAYLNEMKMRGYEFDVIFVDYLNLMRSTKPYKTGDLYGKVKSISEELRAMSYSLNGTPVISASQLNRDGSVLDFDSVNMFHTSESIGTQATTDMSIILGTDETRLVYESELHYKITKNRFGGRVDEGDKFYFDPKTLAMYDSSEMDLWIHEAKITGESLHKKPTNNQKKKGKVS